MRLRGRCEQKESILVKSYEISIDHTIKMEPNLLYSESKKSYFYHKGKSQGTLIMGTV